MEHVEHHQLEVTRDVMCVLENMSLIDMVVQHICFCLKVGLKE